MDLQGKVIVITGASSGFGEAIARRCARAGATVVLAARSAEKLDQLAGQLGGVPGRALAVPTDVSRADEIERLAAITLDRFGRADVLLNNAGFGVLDRFVDARIEDLQEMVEVNLYGTVRCTQAFLPDMLRRRSGQVVIMSSLSGLMASLNMAFYTATKFALVGVARTLMLELAGTGVSCALICPGVAQTAFQKRADVRKYSRATGLVRVGVDQVARATVRAIAEGLNGEVILPPRARPLLAVGGAFPGLARAVMRRLR